MIRKCLAVVVALLFAVGGIFADDIKAVFVKYEDGKVTAKVEDKEKVFKVNPDTKVKQGKKEVPLGDVLSKIKEGTNVTLKVEKDLVEGVTVEKKKK